MILESEDESERIVVLTEVPGQEDEHALYRSELAGLFGLVATVKTLTALGDVRHIGIEVECDGLSALHRSFWHKEENIFSSQTHFDCLSGLHGLNRELDTTWVYRHIAGHQEDVAGAELDRWALMNIEFDVRAKDYWSELGSKVSRVRKQRVTATCPRCGHIVEDSTHVLEYKAASAVAE